MEWLKYMKELNFPIRSANSESPLQDLRSPWDRIRALDGIATNNSSREQIEFFDVLEEDDASMPWTGKMRNSGKTSSELSFQN